MLICELLIKLICDENTHQTTILRNHPKHQTPKNLPHGSRGRDVPPFLCSIVINKEVFEQAALLKLIRLRDSFLQLAQNSKLGKIDVNFSGLNKLEVATSNGNFIL